MIRMMSHTSSLCTEPVWTEALRPSAPQSLKGPCTRADVAVIGGGFTGLSAAYHVLKAQPGAKVILLEAERVGYGASTRNTGMLTPGVGQSLDSLVRRFGAATARQMYQASLQAVHYVSELTSREQIDAGVRMTGQLIVAQGRRGRQRLADQLATLQRLDLPCQPLSEAALRDRLAICTNAPRGDANGPAALRLPVAGLLHPGRLVQGLKEAIERRGGQIVERARVVSVSRGEPAVATLADGHKIEAGHIVLASNGYDRTLGIQRGRVIPLHLRLLLTEPLSTEQLAQLNWSGREGAIDSRRVFNYFRLTEDNRLLFGGGRPRYRWGGQTEDLDASAPDVATLIQTYRRLFPALAELPVSRSWTGVIGFTLDNLPVVGHLPNYRRVVYAGGWCGHGIALSISSGRWVQRLLSGEAVERLPWFRPQSPLLPVEAARWAAALVGGLGMETLDHL
jgi:gamma-glutamylputrescine oxidase